MLRKLSMAVCLATTLTLSAHAADKQKLDERVTAASDVLHELMGTPDKGIPENVASKATCVIVVPGFKKGAFIVGAESGHGVATCRTSHEASLPRSPRKASGADLPVRRRSSPSWPYDGSTKLCVATAPTPASAHGTI